MGEVDIPTHMIEHAILKTASEQYVQDNPSTILLEAGKILQLNGENVTYSLT